MGGITGGSDGNGGPPRHETGGPDSAGNSDVPTGPIKPRPRPGNTGETTSWHETTPRQGPAPETNQLSYWQQAAAGPDDHTSQVDTGYGGYGSYANQPPPLGYGDQPPPLGYADQPPPFEPTEFNLSRPPWAPPERQQRDSSNLALWVALAALLVVVAGGIVVATVLHSSSSKSTAGQPKTSVSSSTTAASTAESSPAASNATTPSASNAGLAGGGSGGATASSTGLDPAGATTGMSAADQIDNLLDQSSAARAGVRPSLDAIRHCAADGATITTLQSASNTRQGLLTQLGTVRFGLLTNGATLRTQLSELLTYSYEADDAYAAWGTDNLGCQDLAPYDQEHSAGDAYSAQATAAKKRFLRAWNPVAGRYGLQIRTESTI